jgi:hypothetical protein
VERFQLGDLCNLGHHSSVCILYMGMNHFLYMYIGEAHILYVTWIGEMSPFCI